MLSSEIPADGFTSLERIFDEPLGESNMERPIKISAGISKEDTLVIICIFYRITKFERGGGRDLRNTNFH